jgi:integrase
VPKEAKPYIKDGWYRTSIGGVQHRKLCRAEEGEKKAKVALARLQVELDEAQRNGTAMPSPGPGIAPLVVSPSALDPKLPTVTQAIDAYLDFQKEEVAPASFEWYKRKLQPMYERFGERPVASLTPEDGTRYKKWLREEKTWRRGKSEAKGLKGGAIHCLRAAMCMLRWVCKPSRRRQYGVTMNPWEELSVPKTKGRKRLITEEEYRHLVDNCTSGSVAGAAQEMREILALTRYTTLRPGEVRLLRWEYIQYAQHRIFFPAEVVKTRNRRIVTLLDEAETLLRERRRRLEQEGKKTFGYVFPLPATADDDVIRAGHGDEPMTSTAFAHRFRRLFMRCVKKGLIVKEMAGERIVPYSTRHTKITALFTEGHSPQVVQQEAGHESPLTTETYKHLAESYHVNEIRRRAEKRNGGSAAAS